MSKNTCIVNGNEFQIEKRVSFRRFGKKIIKDKKIRFLYFIERLVMKSDWKRKNS